MAIDILSFSCPLILCSIAALFSEYAGCLALFIEGLVSFSAFLNFAITVKTQNPVAGFLLTVILATLIIFVFAALTEKLKAHKFIAGTAINLLLSSLISCLSTIFFKTRGVLTSPFYSFNINHTKIFTVILTAVLIAAAIVFLSKTRTGLYLRITGSDSDVLIAKGVNPSVTRILSWGLAAFYSSIAGILLTIRLSSFVPNISSGRGWVALAAIFLGKKNLRKIVIAVLIFCCADFFMPYLQNYIPEIPSSIMISFPYFAALLLIFAN